MKKKRKGGREGGRERKRKGWQIRSDNGRRVNVLKDEKMQYDPYLKYKHFNSP